MTSAIRPTLTMLLLLSALFGLAYPMISTLLVQAMFTDRVEASLMKGTNNEVLGSSLIGQPFSDPRYFWGRLSAAQYNAAASTGSNLGSANPALLENVKARIAALKNADPENTQPIPVDLVTASASGLDPEISVAAAHYQLSRVAKARGVDEHRVREAIERCTSHRQFGILGEPRVNVLMVNLLLDGKIE
ncbi:MAG: potassium-transporting ATPase subunit KdpC [Alphaproteobacteria bacterium]|nr:MAG: potassium-transporting ATPase subunit KdpC [Alphaproteobacteria bacterium]